jgi:RNA polymerase sigma-54 factor
LDLTINFGTEQHLKVSPHLIALNQLLVMSSAELQTEINRELLSNPALEMEERQICPACGTTYRGAYCHYCAMLENGSNEPSYEGTFKFTGTPDEEFDPVSLVAAEMPLTERILMDMAATMSSEDRPIAEFLVGNLDERGYLTVDLESAANVLRVEPERVEEMVELLQEVAPPGVGARNLQECLLIQLKHLQKQGVEANLVEKIITEYFKELGDHQYHRIARQLGVTLDEVREAREFIKQHLTPYPTSGNTGEINGVRYRSKSHYVVPDVIISLKEDNYVVDVVESRRFYLKINSLYSQLADAKSFESEADKEHIRLHVTRARQFMANLNQRRQTIRMIAEGLIRLQEDFIREGVKSLKPLTRAALASYLGIHESTVSRATSGKFVMLPNKKVVSFDDFFHQSLSVKELIREIIENSNKKLTDQEIVDILADQHNVPIARRTVAKYRAQLKILPSTLR